MVIEQYPHTLKTTTVGNDATYDENTGKWIPGTPTTTTIEEKCRAESSAGSGYLTQADGTRIDFSWIVYFPRTVSKKAYGESIKVYDEQGDLMLEDTVKRFFRGPFNARAWL